MAKFSKIPLSVEGGALERYLEELRGKDFNPLEREEEQELVHQAQAGDEEAKERLIESNLRFVITVAKIYINQGVSLEDLISEGNLGLIEAVSRFDPERGFKFISYAVWWIRHAILTALADKGRPVRLPQNKVAMSRQIFQAARHLEQETGHSPNLVEIAEELNLDPEQVEQSLDRTRRQRSLDAPLGDGDEDWRLMDVTDSGASSPEKEAMGQVLHEEILGILGTLDEREAEIIRLYYGLEGQGPMKLDEIGERYGLTRERIRQIRERALSRLRHPSRAERLREFWE